MPQHTAQNNTRTQCVGCSCACGQAALGRQGSHLLCHQLAQNILTVAAENKPTRANLSNPPVVCPWPTQSKPQSQRGGTTKRQGRGPGAEGCRRGPKVVDPPPPQSVLCTHPSAQPSVSAPALGPLLSCSHSCRDRSEGVLVTLHLRGSAWSRPQRGSLGGTRFNVFCCVGLSLRAPGALPSGSRPLSASTRRPPQPCCPLGAPSLRVAFCSGSSGGKNRLRPKHTRIQILLSSILTRPQPRDTSHFSLTISFPFLFLKFLLLSVPEQEHIRH